MTNWYEQSIKNLFERYMLKAGYDIEFDSSKFYGDELERMTKGMGLGRKNKFRICS